jgi:hypothetical protein
MAIELVLGPSTHLQTACMAERYALEASNAGSKLLVICFHQAEAVTPGDLNLPNSVSLPCVRTNKLHAVARSFDTVFIHDAHLFPDLKAYVLQQHVVGRTCLVYALDSDHHQNKFGELWDLIPYAHKITKPLAVCCNPACLNYATCTRKAGERLLAVCYKCL